MTEYEARHEYDVVVIGCGMAGLAASIAAAEEGASVAVIEKAPEERRGGHTQFTESFRFPTAEFSDEYGYDFNVEYTSSDYYQDFMKQSNMWADEDLLSTLVSEAAGTLEWLTDLGMDWETQPPHPGYTSGRVWLDGEEMIDHLVGVLEDLGGEVYYDAPARDLVQDSHGRVVGVDAAVDGDRTRFDAGAVVLACGDYGSSKEKRTKYYGPGFEHMKVRGSRYNTGEAIEMALDIGAKDDGEWSGAHMALIDAASPDYEGGITRIDGYQYGAILNHDGERFVDEGQEARAMTYAKFGRIIFGQPYHEAFIIVDSKVVDDVAHMGPSREISADSIESLVRRLDIEDPETAVETIEAFNEACDPDAFESYEPNELDGNSAEGIEPPKTNWAMPIDEPPFYGYPVTGGYTFGYGGVAINTEAEVIDKRDEPMPGFYAAGNSTGGLFHDNYPGGSGLTNAAVYGRIAGENAAADALGDG